ncbi:MAG: hypothetical protein Q9214_003773 [Letrouitia sp. 1 TL-2023]
MDGGNEMPRERNYRRCRQCRWEPLTKALGSPGDPTKHATPFIGPFPIQKDHLPNQPDTFAAKAETPAYDANPTGHPQLYLSPP